MDNKETIKSLLSPNNINNNIKSITSLNLETSEAPSLKSPDNNESFLSRISARILAIPFYGWLLIILVLAFLGINIFIYFALGTEKLVELVNKIIKPLFGTSLQVTGQTISVSAEGAKKVLSGTVSELEKGLTDIQEVTSPEIEKNINSKQEASLNKALVEAEYKEKKEETNYEEDSSTSNIQSTSKSGWCYIGTSKGVRSCATVGINDKCMSGDIFPSQEICMNPSLRA